MLQAILSKLNSFNYVDYLPVQFLEFLMQEMEVEQRLKEMQDIAKAELAAAIASEKAYQIEKMAEANLHV